MAFRILILLFFLVLPHWVFSASCEISPEDFRQVHFAEGYLHTFQYCSVVISVDPNKHQVTDGFKVSCSDRQATNQALREKAARAFLKQVLSPMMYSIIGANPPDSSQQLPSENRSQFTDLMHFNGGDFGAYAAISKNTGLVLFSATYNFMGGGGVVLHPRPWEPAKNLGLGCAQVPAPRIKKVYSASPSSAHSIPSTNLRATFQTAWNSVLGQTLSDLQKFKILEVIYWETGVLIVNVELLPQL